MFPLENPESLPTLNSFAEFMSVIEHESGTENIEGILGIPDHYPCRVYVHRFETSDERIRLQCYFNYKVHKEHHCGNCRSATFHYSYWGDKWFEGVHEVRLRKEFTVYQGDGKTIKSQFLKRTGDNRHGYKQVTTSVDTNSSTTNS